MSLINLLSKKEATRRAEIKRIIGNATEEIPKDLKDLFIKKKGEQKLGASLKTISDSNRRDRREKFYSLREFVTPVKSSHGVAKDSHSMDIMMQLSEEKAKRNIAKPTVQPVVEKKTEKPEVLGTQAKAKNSIVYNEKQRQKAINTFVKNASTVKPDLPFRSTPQKAKENAKYVNQYLNEVFDKAPKYNLDPMLITAIAAQESGWGGQRYGNNLVGYGKFEVGKSLDTDYSEKSIPDAVDSLLKKISTDWGGQYQNKSTPEEYVQGKYKWNVHKSWVKNVGIIRNNLN